MIRSETLELVAEVNARWPHAPLPETTAALWTHELADLPMDRARTALAAYDRSGERFPPTAGALRHRVVCFELDAPDWSEVKVALARRSAVNAEQAGCERCGGSTFLLDEETGYATPCECRAERQRRAKATRHPLVAAFAEEIGSGEVRDLDDRVAEAQVREKYLAFVARAAEDRRLAGLPTAGLSRLERVNGEPRRLDAALANVLPPGPDAADEADHDEAELVS